MVVALYFGLHRSSLPVFLTFGVAVATLLVYTTPHRFGVCVAIDYWTRVRWGDLAGSPAPPVDPGDGREAAIRP